MPKRFVIEIEFVEIILTQFSTFVKRYYEIL
jgi:hypothetical protein